MFFLYNKAHQTARTYPFQATPMTAISDLDTLLRQLSPRLNPGEYVFCCLADGRLPADAEVLGSFREAEGLTLILPRAEAEHLGLDYHYCAAWITLQVPSDLAAVGLTAAFASALAAAHISCNVIAGFHHDHLFVASADAERALATLQALAAEQEH